MKIIGLVAENVKRLKAVEIQPDGTLQVIGGRNAQGKSSVLDAIWLALGGGKASKETPLPIRDGEDHASVRLDLGDLIVTRSWTAKGTSLKVENADGAAYSSPQGMLDALVGQLSFDPLAFTRLSPKDQKKALLDLVDLEVDLDALDAQIKETFENRTRIGREGKALGDVSVDESLPEVETSISEIVAEIQEINDVNEERVEADRQIERQSDAIDYTTNEIESLEEQLEEARSRKESQEATLQELQVMRAKMPEIRSTAALRERLAGAEDANALIRANNAAREKAKQKEDLRLQYEAATAELQRLETVKIEALRKAKFPVVGLSFDDNGPTYRGIPLSQASSAEQIRVSLAMGMALNPKLRVLMIKDGSLLDEESMAAIRDQVAEKGYQLWIERVGNADEGAVILEDGEVA